VLAIALYALYGRKLSGAWRWIYVITAVIALYLNSFVGVVQAFQKLPPLQPHAPAQSEPSFQIAQLALLLVFIVLGFLAVWKFHPERMGA
jgi:MFS family permease